MTGLRMFCAFDVLGFELGCRRIWWTSDDAVPWMSTPTADGRELALKVHNPAFAVELGSIAKRRQAMKRAAEAFFAPLLDGAS